MPFLIGLFSPVFTLRMCAFNSLLLALTAAQPVFMRHRGHQIDKHVIDGGYPTVRTTTTYSVANFHRTDRKDGVV